MTKTFLCLFALVLAAIGRAPSGARAEGVPEDAVAAWRAMERAARGRIVMHFSQREHDRPDAHDFQWRMERAGANAVVYDGSEGSLTLRNSQGNFGLTEIDNGRWRLAFAEPLGGGRADRLFRLSSDDLVFFPQVKILGTTLGRMWLSDKAQFTKWTAVEQPDGRVLARFTIEASATDLQHFFSAGSYDVVVDPARDYRIESYEYRGGQFKIVVRLDYGATTDESLAGLRTEATTYDSGKEAMRSVAEIQEFSRAAPASEVFDLSHYGIDNVAFSTSRWPWIYGGLILFGLTFVLMFKLLKRSTSQG